MDKYLLGIFLLYIAVLSFGYFLDYINLSHLKRFGNKVPPEFEGHIDHELLKKTRDYTIEQTRFGFLSSIFDNILTILFLFGGLLGIYDAWFHSLSLSFIIAGFFFFIIMVYAETILTIPFSLYSTFRIEKKYGFNTMTPGIWVTDFFKSLLISTVLMALLIAAGLFLVQKSPDFWWFWVWCFFLAFGIFIMYVSPYVIEPLFNKFTPLDDKGLEDDIRELMKKVGIKVSRVFMMDASKRTRHTNAYFTGIGRVKRIVFYDTLLQKMDGREVLTVLAHEAGHWKKKHLLKGIVVTEAIALIGLYVAHKLLQYNFLADIFGIANATFYTKAVIIAFLGSILSFPFSPVFNYISRRHEVEADRFSYDMTGDAESMISTLVKLSKDNLSNLHPHPLYAKFHYSHPPVLERIKRLREIASDNPSSRA